MTVDPTPLTAAPSRPLAAERARTVAGRLSAALHVVGVGAAPVLAATTTAAGAVLVVVPSTGSLMTALAGSPVGDLPARLTVVDRAPLPLVQPVRGQLELSGWLTPVRPHDEQRLLLDFAEACPSDVLFEVGLTATLLRLDLAGIALEEAGLVTDVDPDDFLSASPDPVSRAERDLLAEHAAALDRLTDWVRCWAGRRSPVHLLGLDRCGVRFRVEGRRGACDVRVPFPAPLPEAAGFGAALAALLRCA